ncbi:MAG: hypothetical protein WAU70_04905 [Flavobacteriales bacterium]
MAKRKPASAINSATPGMEMPDRVLRLAIVDEAMLYRNGWDIMLEEAGGNEVVLSVIMGSELLHALRGGAVVDVVILRLYAQHGTTEGLLNALKNQFPGTRTLVCYGQVAEEAAERVKAEATWFMSLVDITKARLPILLQEIRAAL